MKGLLCLGLLVLASPAVAQTHVYETAKGSGTVTNVSISTTSGAIQLDSSARVLTERFVLEVWNDDDADDLFCGFNVNVSTISTNVNYGRRVPPRTSWLVAVQNSVPIYCRVAGSGAAASAIAVISQLW